MRIPLDTAYSVGLGPGDIVLDEDRALLQEKGTTVPTFRPTALACIPAGPHSPHNPYCRLGSVRRAALVAILRIIATSLVAVDCVLL